MNNNNLILCDFAFTIQQAYPFIVAEGIGNIERQACRVMLVDDGMAAEKGGGMNWLVIPFDLFFLPLTKIVLISYPPLSLLIFFLSPQISLDSSTCYINHMLLNPNIKFLKIKWIITNYRGVFVSWIHYLFPGLSYLGII
jgi:hypothetical protein